MSFRPAVLTFCLLLAAPAAVSAADVRGFDVRDLVRLERVSSPVLSPDGSVVVFAQRSVDADLKAATALYARNLLTRDLRPPHRITPEGWNVNSPSFSPDGRTVYFLSAKNGSQQLYAMPLSGGEPRQLTDIPLDIGSYRISPDGRKVAFSVEAFPDCGADFACTKKRLDERAASRSSGVIYDQLFVRHWDTWKDGRLSRLFVADLPGGPEAVPVASARAVGADVVGDVPSRPFGDAGDYTWSPDGSSIVASIRLADRTEPWSTNFDLYRLPLDGGAAVNLTVANKAWDAGPVFSPDGSTLYYRAMKRPGFEADRYALMAMDVATGQVREIAPDWDRSAEAIAVSADGTTLYVTAQSVGQHPLFAVDVATGKVTELVAEGTVSAFDVAGDTIALTRNTLHTNDVLYVTSAANPQALRQITPAAGERLPDVRFGDAEQFSFKGWNGETVYGYVVKPWNYEEGRRYPVAFLIHGGPQGSFGNAWSYRWNPQTYAGQGYAVVMIDFHGSTGYGQAFTDSISGHWGDRPLEDLQKGWAAAQQKYPFLDGDRACALGASYGGYMTNWIAGNWNEPWKCLVTHNGVFDTRSMGLVTEELWFPEWEFGGTVADNPGAYEAFNPARHIHRWKVPMLVVAGQNDFRVPIDQSLSAFTALQRAGIESKLLYFPDENHWVLKPHNSVLWHDTVNDWLRKHIGQ
jgi:dipeptidyl aminopeptidase/acylaminoacyl peptidase